MTPQELDQFAQTVSAFKAILAQKKKKMRRAFKKKPTILTWALESLYEGLVRVEQLTVLVKEEQAQPLPKDIRRKIKNNNAFYTKLLEEVDSGPFEGGCVIVAQMLQFMYGGEIVVLAREDNSADHAVLRLPDGRFLDADGVARTEKTMIQRFNRNERAHTTHIRPLENNDLPDAPRNEQLSKTLIGLL